MAQVVGSHGVAVFTSPNNGDTLDATVVKGNDNNMRSAYVDHDADGGLHVQSSAIVSRPAAGSIGRKWLTADTSSYRLFFDDGSSWYELSYLSSNGGTITGNLDVTGTITGAVTGNASTATALQTARNINGVAFNGTADITVTAAAGTLTGATLASGVTASSLTSVGTLGTLTVSGNATFDTDTLVINASTDRVGLGTASPVTKVHVNDGTNRNVLITTDATQLGSAGMAIGSFTDAGVAYAPLSIIGSTIRFAPDMTLDTSGNLGLGVTSSTWGAGYKVFELGRIGSAIMSTVSTGTINVLGNAVFNGTNYVYANSSSPAARYLLGTGSGQHQWFTAPSGTAGNAISFTQAMTLDASGNLGLGVTPSASWSAGFKAVQIATQGMSLSASTSTNDTYLNNNGVYNGTNWLYQNSAAAAQYRQLNGGHSWLTAPSGTAGNAISFTQAMTLDASGNLLVGTTTATGAAASRGLIVVNGLTAGSAAVNLTVNNTWTGTYYADTGGVTVGAVANIPLLFTTNNTERARIDINGNLGVGVAAFGTSAAKIIGIANGTAPTTSPAGMGQLYVEGGALKFRGSSGTVTTIANA